MIKEHDLRLGNYVWGVSDIIEQISELQRDKVETLFRGHLYNYCTYEDISPIGLSPEILEKAGFERFHEFDMADEHWKIKTATYDFAISLLHGRYVANIWFQVHLTSLHQLQNLYYILTNTELTITL